MQFFYQTPRTADDFGSPFADICSTCGLTAQQRDRKDWIKARISKRVDFAASQWWSSIPAIRVQQNFN
jgi:hypothetical protein